MMASVSRIAAEARSLLIVCVSHEGTAYSAEALGLCVVCSDEKALPCVQVGPTASLLTFTGECSALVL